MVDDIQDRSLHKLRFHHRRNDFQQRLSRKYHGSFRDRIDISGKMKSSQIFQKIFIKNIQRAQIIDIIRRKMQVANVLYHLFQACRHRIGAAAWILAVKCVKYDDLVCGILKISLHHCQFI